MDPWVFEDGTEVRLGGAVSGDSEFAEIARVAIRSAKVHGVSGFGAQPHNVEFDPSVPYLLDCFLRHRFTHDKIVSAPEVEYPELKPRQALPPGCVY